MSKSTSSIEIPMGQKSLAYRLFEKLPGALSWIILLLALILSAWNAMFGAVYILIFISAIFIKGLVSMYNSMLGYKTMRQCESIDWHQRLLDLDKGQAFHQDTNEYQMQQHLKNIELYQRTEAQLPRVNQVYNLVIIAAYNETAEVLQPTIKSLIDTTYDKQHLIVCLAYEQRGGAAMKQTAELMLKKYKKTFFDFVIIEHPSKLPNEVVGKGGNISFACRQMSQRLRQQQIDPDDVIVTTLDSDNRPHLSYFDYLTYEFIVNPCRHQVSFQPISLYLNNIWDVPAPVRVMAASNSFWNIICTVRLHKLRNFASHAQSLKALEDMNYWSRRTIVEDGHQFWRSYFHFYGKYTVIPIRVPIYQDAVLSSTYRKTLKDQFIQIRRWAYGASDVPYVAMMIWRRRKQLPLADAVWKFFDLLEGHVTWATTAILVTVGGWLPLLFYGNSGRSLVAHRLPLIVGLIQRLAMVGLLTLVVFSIKLLPPRPKRYKPIRNLSMLLQWIVMPLSSVLYTSSAALYSQTRLLLGRYLDRFDVTDKNVVRHD